MLVVIWISGYFHLSKRSLRSPRDVYWLLQYLGAERKTRSFPVTVNLWLNSRQLQLAPAPFLSSGASFSKSVHTDIVGVIMMMTDAIHRAVEG